MILPLFQGKTPPSYQAAYVITFLWHQKKCAAEASIVSYSSCLPSKSWAPTESSNNNSQAQDLILNFSCPKCITTVFSYCSAWKHKMLKNIKFILVQNKIKKSTEKVTLLHKSKRQECRNQRVKWNVHSVTCSGGWRVDDECWPVDSDELSRSLQAVILSSNLPHSKLCS